MIRATLALALIFIAATAQAHTPEEYRVLAEVICEKETRNYPEPWEAKPGEIDKDHAVGPDGELGRCQIKPTTALMLGVTFEKLANPEVSMQTAVAYLRYCASQGWHGKGWKGTYWGAHCYNAGHNGEKGAAHIYAKSRAVEYAHAIALIRWHKAHIRLAER